MIRLLLCCCLLVPMAAAAAPRVVVDVPPVHSLVAAVMQGVGEPTLLIKGGRSPHDYALRPSDAGALANADVIVWVGENLDSVLAKPIASLGGKARVLELMDVPGMALLPARSGGVWAAEGEHAGHGHGDFDPHLWLAPENARQIVSAVTGLLAAADPADAERYRQNAAAVIGRIDRLQAALAAQLKPVAGIPFLVFHDAYQYFDRAFGLHAVGSVSINPDRPPGARRLGELRALLLARGAVCIFSEPQFPSPLVGALIAGSSVRQGVLDPVGAGLEPGPGLWFALMQRLTDNLNACLARPDGR